MKYLKIIFRQLVYYTSLTICSGAFRVFFFFFFAPDSKSEKNSHKSTNKKIWPNANFPLFWRYMKILSLDAFCTTY